MTKTKGATKTNSKSSNSKAKSSKKAGPRRAKRSQIAAGLRSLAVPMDTIKTDPGNARRHTMTDLQAISESLRRYGQRTPLVVNRRGRVIEKGNGTYEAARLLGWSTIAVLWVSDDPATQYGYAVADNRTAELSEWDQAKLDLLLGAHQEELGGDFGDILLLDRLRSTEEKAAEEVTFSAGGEIKAYQVLIECAHEEDQKEVFEHNTKRGYKCRAITV